MSFLTPYEILLLPAIDSGEDACRIDRMLSTLPTEHSLCDTQESVRLTTDTVCNSDSLLPRIDKLLQARRERAVIVVGDHLVDSGADDYTPASLTERLRSVFLDQSNVKNGNQCGLVALVPGPAKRTRDVDSVLDTTALSPESLQQAILRTSNGLWLKSQHARATMVGDDARNRGAIHVQVVQSEDQLKDCFQLRHRVYDWMGYLDDELAQSESKLDIDPFDRTSLHFAAIDLRSKVFIGTLRLVVSSVPATRRRSSIGEPSLVMRTQKDWCKEIAKKSSDAVVRERLRSNLRLPMPILQNSDFGEHWPEFLQGNRARQGGEISRLVVSPRYRGLGISRLLLRAGIAVACDLKKTHLLLECIPGHAAMYRKSGFELLEGHHCRAQGLDQIAVGMRLQLENSPLNRSVSLATRDIGTLQNALDAGAVSADELKSSARCAAFCLCEKRKCWKDGHYSLRGHDNCPLSHLP